MFDNLTEKLQRTFKNLRGQGKLTEEHLDAALVRAVHDSGRGVLAYTVNDSETALDLREWGVDALVTDQLDVIAPAFA